MMTKICNSCGASVSADMQYCPHCGAYMDWGCGDDQTRMNSEYSQQYQPWVQQHPSPPRKTDTIKTVLVSCVVALGVAVLVLGGWIVGRKMSDKPSAQSQTETKSPVTLLHPTSITGKYTTYGNLQYVPNNLLDGKMNTCWAVDLRDPTNYTNYGIGPLRIAVNCKKLDHLVVYNGYQKSNHVYNINCRPKSIVAYNPKNMASPILYGQLADGAAPQTIKAADTEANSDLTEIVVYIPDYYTGTKYYDLCITALEVHGEQ